MRVCCVCVCVCACVCAYVSMCVVHASDEWSGALWILSVSTDLPFGWEEARTEDGQKYYVK